MSNPKYTKNAKKNWKTVRKMFERFRKENGREMTPEEFRKLRGGC